MLKAINITAKFKFIFLAHNDLKKKLIVAKRGTFMIPTKSQRITFSFNSQTNNRR
jgi:hypothetical protein